MEMQHNGRDIENNMRKRVGTTWDDAPVEADPAIAGTKGVLASAIEFTTP
jgi:hypothetical protein